MGYVYQYTMSAWYKYIPRAPADHEPGARPVGEQLAVLLTRVTHPFQLQLTQLAVVHYVVASRQRRLARDATHTNPSLRLT